MKKPKMILFDYGQTIIEELYYDAEAGNKEIMKYATKNKYNKTPKEITEFSNELNSEFGLYDITKLHKVTTEVPNIPFCNYLYEYLGIEFSISKEEMERIFWDYAAPPRLINGIEELLEFLKNNNIRTGIISNISISGKVFRNRINKMLPNNNFEFIIPSSEYVFRKPSKRIFDLAIHKADLKPEDIWFCGDQMKCDIVGSYNAGMQPVWFKEKINFKQEGIKDIPYIEVNSWSELKEIIEKL